MKFQIKSDFSPTGDQPTAIDSLVFGLEKNKQDQVLLGVTGSGKTFTIANVIERTQKPTLIISPNKTLAAQLYQEFRDFFPDNAVSYFVSYYDYYQPEAYIPTTDTYIEKETEINEEIDKLRLRATTNLLTRKDCIVIASVSCIYNIGSPLEYGKFILELNVGQSYDRKELLSRFTALQYTRSDFGFARGTFRVKGDTIDFYPSYEDFAIRIEMLGDTITKIKQSDPISGELQENLENFILYPAKHYLVEPEKMKAVFEQIRADTVAQCQKLRSMGKEMEAHRLNQRVTYDLEMINEVGYVNGIENYSRYFDGRQPGDAPHSLLEYFPKDYLLVIDESHLTIPQIGGMYKGDSSRKQTLIDYGFRLPAALDNRPLKFEEFEKLLNQTIYVSATPGDWEMARSQQSGNESVVEQLIRPTGILDPQIEVRSSVGQIKDLIAEIKLRVERHERVLVTTLTKRTAEELTDYLNENETGIKVEYLHSEILTLERSAILERLRRGKADVLVGINLLREGLDLPEVTLVAILDADKEGFLRSERSLIQTMGRAARNIESRVILYADQTTNSMQRAMSEVNRRRKIQKEWNEAHGITPVTIIKPIRNEIFAGYQQKKNKKAYSVTLDEELKNLTPEELLPEEKEKLVVILRRRMKEAAKILDFESAQYYKEHLEKLIS